MFRCPDCGGRRRIIAAITAPEPIRQILDHVGLPCTVPIPQPARPPPSSQLHLPAPDPDAFPDPPSLFD